MPLPSLGRLGTRTNLKAVNPGKHRNPQTKPEEELVEDHELTSYLAALAPAALAPESDLESTGTGKRFGEAQVMQLRLSPVANEQLTAVATERGLSPQAVAQEWILERLSWESQAGSQLPQAPQAPQAAPQAQWPAPQTPQVGRAALDEEAHTDQHVFEPGWDQPALHRR